MTLKGMKHCSVGPEALMDPSGTAEHCGHLRVTWSHSELGTSSLFQVGLSVLEEQLQEHRTGPMGIFLRTVILSQLNTMVFAANGTV